MALAEADGDGLDVGDADGDGDGDGETDGLGEGDGLGDGDGLGEAVPPEIVKTDVPEGIAAVSVLSAFLVITVSVASNEMVIGDVAAALAVAVKLNKSVKVLLVYPVWLILTHPTSIVTCPAASLI